jgi:hypothetical protein
MLKRLNYADKMTARRGRQRNASSPNAKWRLQPPTEAQMRWVRSILEHCQGVTHSEPLTSGEASRLITEHGARLPSSVKRSLRRKRRRQRRTEVNPAANWRFGHGQTAEQEAREIEKARRDGLENVYVELQRRNRQLTQPAANEVNAETRTQKFAIPH